MYLHYDRHSCPLNGGHWSTGDIEPYIQNYPVHLEQHSPFIIARANGKHSSSGTKSQKNEVKIEKKQSRDDTPSNGNYPAEINPHAKYAYIG